MTSHSGTVYTARRRPRPRVLSLARRAVRFVATAITLLSALIVILLGSFVLTIGMDPR